MYQGSRCLEFAINLLATTLLVAPRTFAQIPSTQMLLMPPSEIIPIASEPISVDFESSQDMPQQNNSIDPLDSPHPVPWNWVMETYWELSSNGGSGLRYYRSPSLISPDGRYAAYSRIKLHSQTDLFRSQVTSVMFMENLQTGDLQTITASSPLADNPFDDNQAANIPGAISILIPVSWSENGDRILSRQFEDIFSTSEASDYAVIWNRDDNSTSTVAPEQINYTNAVLLGWSETYPEQVLFRAGTLGDEEWPIWAVNVEGKTAIAGEDQPKVFGTVVNQIWTGPQGLRP